VILFALLLGVPCLLVAGLAGTLMIGFKRSDAYAASFKYVAQHGLVKQELGTPVDDGFFATGSLRVTPAGGDSQLRFEICGPEACADAFVAAQGLGGEWRVVDAVLTLNGKTHDIGPG
jgi:hypothetical protein